MFCFYEKFTVKKCLIKFYKEKEDFFVFKSIDSKKPKFVFFSDVHSFYDKLRFLQVLLLCKMDLEKAFGEILERK